MSRTNHKGLFKKGHLPWNTGKKFSDELKKKLSDSHKGKGLKSCNNNWKGGRYEDNGYVLICMGEHPFAVSNGYVLEHRLVMEKHIGRTLLPTEVVHHINGIRNDNRIENLMLYSSNKEHQSMHFPKGSRWGINKIQEVK
jgi:hypothetical protein